LSGFLDLGGDGFLLVEALIVSLLVAVLAWRRVGPAAGSAAVAVVVIALILYNAGRPNASPGLNFAIVRSLFMIVPAAILLTASRQRWLARHAWVLILIGPVLFVGCYVGICELCVKTGVI
jgi:hypothetical protein